ncbi:peptidoglycan D,D-transpeptidase FtsI family protein [Pseudonocardia kunmingensis]|uniref:Cell division protein FtsI (Penicillin-binding protein 3) n=1 Tax=Pseudonocardia kunmingensis TaxID=630975 RepID=A0A543DXP5_9PSEU|nr:penicillin-binding protein 2 [Pseudonocardia kunmingensis]TQM14086.1 cell division protein FtsI (penicillin-binding protein 3) [Pseudonocardia kunmingensis]
MTTAPPRPRAAGAAARRPPPPRTPEAGIALGQRRLKVGRILLVVVLAIATLKLVAVQTVQAGELTAASERQSTTNIRLPAERGAITDRDGAPLAFSVDARALVTNPRLIAQNKGPEAERYTAEMATAVGQATGQDPNALLEQLRSDRGYVVLARLVAPEVARDLGERFPEIAQERREDRQYPAGMLAANVVGSSTWNADERKLTGRVGLESSQDNLLSGFEGLRVVDTAEDSNAVIPGSTRFERAAVQGSDMRLTLDSDLQFTVQQALTEYVARTGADVSSSAVVLDARTSEVLAMANGQTFDPRDLSSATPEQLRNTAVQGTFEPGSVIKVITMAAALEYGVAKPDDVLTVPGSIRVADRTIGDSWDHGTERYTLTGVLAKSSNVGTIMTAQEVGEERFADMLSRFGLGEQTGVGLPGEEPGQVPPRESWSGSTFGNLPIGQGLTVTTLQMASMLQTVANDGVRVPPRIVASTTGPDGVPVAPPPPEPVRVVSPETAQQLRTMLTAVTQDARGQRGTGHQAAVPGYAVAGKTGTAQQVNPACGCYSSSLHWINFAGMLPADDPRYVIAIMLDAPDPGTSAAPLFHDIATYLAQRERLPVSDEPPPVQTLQLP